MADPAIPSSDFRRKCRPRFSNWPDGAPTDRLKKTYEKMRYRCENPKAEAYPRYGAVGILVCEEWRNSSRAFYLWAMANGYRDGLQIDREKNHLGYSPGNCRWVTHEQQQNNRTNNTRLEHNGENLTMAEWSRKIGIGRTTLSARHHKGWPVEEVLSLVKR